MSLLVYSELRDLGTWLSAQVCAMRSSSTTEKSSKRLKKDILYHNNQKEDIFNTEAIKSLKRVMEVSLMQCERSGLL